MQDKCQLKCFLCVCFTEENSKNSKKIMKIVLFFFLVEMCGTLRQMMICQMEAILVFPKQ